MAGVLSRLTKVNSSDVELSVKNGIWSQRGYQIAPGFVDLCRGKYGADADFADFKTSAKVSCSKINAWAEQNTKGKIRNLFTPGSITSDTRLVLANAVYFKGKWASQFDKGKTRARPFWVAPERPVQAPTMAQKSTFPYASNDIAQVIELPYRGSELSMLVLLPQAKGGLAELEATLTLTSLTNWIDRLYLADVDLLLPKFKIDSRLSLGQSLANIGVRDALDEARADFSGITSDRPFFIGSVEHGAVIEVDEEGTVAAAATGASFGCAQKPRPAAFHADRPFLFIILDRPTHTVLFVGRVTDPNA
jgi:serpin B